jgi:hypothetical protein
MVDLKRETAISLPDAMDTFPPEVVIAQYLAHCWIPRRIFHRWLVKHNLPLSPPRFEPHGADELDNADEAAVDAASDVSDPTHVSGPHERVANLSSDAIEPQMGAEPLQKVPTQDAPTAKKSKVPTADLEAWYEGRVKNWLPQNPPSEHDDRRTAIAHFSEFNVTREQIRSVRKDHAPPAWKARGRRPDFQDPDKLTDKLAIKPANK